jgi:glycerol-3-phosphate acyltransferase PlsY
MSVLLVLLGAYLVGAIPFGYLIARSRGVDLFKAGSGNIGATNVGRVLGRKFGLLVFVLDFLKGALPVLACSLLPNSLRTSLDPASTLPVLVGLFAFLGHLYPVYLGFRGGKGVATGAGTVAVLIPFSAAVAILVWLTVTCSSLMVSLGSVAAVLALTTARLLGTSAPFEGEAAPLTLYCLGGTCLVIVKHLGNLNRIARGTESRWPNSPRWQIMSKAIHLLAVGLWFGSAIFFNFVAAPAMNQSFRQTVQTAPNDRTAHVDITRGLEPDQKDSLASALFGTAVGPLFPRFYAIQGLCCVLALITALRWWSLPERVHRWRVIVLAFGVVLVGVSWPLSEYVADLRLERYSLDLERAAAAKSAFVLWHLVSLFLSAITALVTIFAMIFAAWLPATQPEAFPSNPPASLNGDGKLQAGPAASESAHVR